MNDRDHFAAAALTGLLASGMDSVDEMPTRAYRMADAMLRERERTNHDAAPAARASLPTADHAVCRGRGSGCGTGDTYSASACDGADVLSTHDSGGPINRAANWGQPPAHSGESERRDVPHPETKGQAAGGPAHNTTEPVAWAVMLADGERIYDVYTIEEEAKAIDEAVTGNHGIVPIYRSPPLTDAEQEAVNIARNLLAGTAHGKSLGSLLERLGGGK